MSILRAAWWHGALAVAGFNPDGRQRIPEKPQRFSRAGGRALRRPERLSQAGEGSGRTGRPVAKSKRGQP